MAASCVQQRGGKPATAESPNAAFEVSELLRRCMGDRALAAALMKKFTARLAPTIQEVERSLAAGEPSRAISIVHNLKGEAGSMSASYVQRDAASLEDCLRAGRQDEADFHLGRLKASAEQCRIAQSGALEQLRDSD